MSTGSKVIIFVFLLIITISGIYLFLRYLKNNMQETNFVNLIVEIDSFIASGYYNQADELIFSASKSANTPLNYKRLLKRALEVRGYKNLETIAQIAYQKYSKEDLILSVYIFVLLRNGKSEMAASILLNRDNQLVPESLYIETNIKNKDYYEGDNFLYRGLDEKSVSIYLEYRKLQFLIKYDSGEFDIALERLDIFDCSFSIQEILLLRIDIRIRQGLFKKAKIAIAEFLDLYPDYSWVPYYNYIWLNAGQAIIEPDTTIQKGLEIYPNNKRLMLIVMDYYIENEKDKDAINLIENFIKNNQIDDELEIILKELEGSKDQEYIVNRVRDFVNRNPENISASKYLAWNIFENNDISHLQHFLDQTERVGNDGWINFFRALISAGNGEYIIAVEQFESSYKLELQWETLYNLAIISEYTNDYQNSIEYYQKADNSLANNVENMITKSMIRTALATLLYEINDYEHSYRELRNALDLDMHNLKANLLLNKLESITF